MAVRQLSPSYNKILARSNLTPLPSPCFTLMIRNGFHSWKNTEIKLDEKKSWASYQLFSCQQVALVVWIHCIYPQHLNNGIEERNKWVDMQRETSCRLIVFKLYQVALMKLFSEEAVTEGKNTLLAIFCTAQVFKIKSKAWETYLGFFETARE